MLSKITEQLSTAMQPFNTLVEINTKAVEQLVNQQAAFVTSLLKESVAQSKLLATQTDIASALESQKSYAEALQAKVNDSAKQAIAVVTKTSEEVSELVKGSLPEMAQFTK